MNSRSNSRSQRSQKSLLENAIEYKGSTRGSFKVENITGQRQVEEKQGNSSCAYFLGNLFSSGNPQNDKSESVIEKGHLEEVKFRVLEWAD